MCKGTATISRIVTYPFYPAAIEVGDDDVSERGNHLYLVILKGVEDSHRNIKISENENNYEVPMELLYKRRQSLRPHVEIGQGMIKPEILQYPPDYFKKRLQYLMKLKEKQGERT